METPRQRRQPLSRKRKLAFTVVVFIPFLLCIEIALRWRGELPPSPPAPVEDLPDDAPTISLFGYFAICDETLGFRNRRNGVYHQYWIKGSPTISTDGSGYRNGFGWPGDGKAPIVLFVGDSFTFCAEVNDDETGPSEVAKLLHGNVNVRVLNAGVAGYSLLQSKRMLAECFERFPNIRLVVYSHCGNDLCESMVPNLRYPAKAPVIIQDKSTGGFREIEVSSPAVPWGESFVESHATRPEPTQLDRVSEWMYSHCAIYHACREAWRAATFLCKAFPGGNDTIPDRDIPFWETWVRCHGASAVTRRILLEMKALCEEHGAGLLATHVMYNEENLIEPTTFPRDCEASGVPFCSLDAAFRPDARPYITQYPDGTWEGHFNAHGNRAFAAILAPIIERNLVSQVSSADVE